MISRRLRITGRVQNVFYRNWFVEQARSLGLDGWVRNRADGSVEALVRGSPGMIDAMVATAREGSPASRVEQVLVSDDAPAEVPNGFARLPTL